MDNARWSLEEMLKRLVSKLKQEQGFTLAEMLVTISILGVILTSLCGVLIHSIAAHEQTVAESIMHDRAITAEKQLSNDLTGSYKIIDALPNRLTLENQDCKYISYYVSNSKLYRVECTTENPTYSGGQPISDSIESLQFKYLRWRHDPIGGGDYEYDVKPWVYVDDVPESAQRVAFSVSFHVGHHQYVIYKQVRLRNNPWS